MNSVLTAPQEFCSVLHFRVRQHDEIDSFRLFKEERMSSCRHAGKYALKNFTIFFCFCFHTLSHSHSLFQKVAYLLPTVACGFEISLTT